MTRIEAINRAMSALKYCYHQPGFESHKQVNDEAHDVLDVMLDELHEESEKASEGNQG